MQTYDTLLEALNALRAQGYTTDFNLHPECIVCKDTQVRLSPSEFEITGVYRFEGMTNPSDNAVLYVIEGKNGMKGTLVDAYGAYSDPLNAEMVAKLKERHQTRL